jgi:hypothetical protein
VGTDAAGSYIHLVADILEALPPQSSHIYSKSPTEILKLADIARVCISSWHDFTMRIFYDSCVQGLNREIEVQVLSWILDINLRRLELCRNSQSGTCDYELEKPTFALLDRLYDRCHSSHEQACNARGPSLQPRGPALRASASA